MLQYSSKKREDEGDVANRVSTGRHLDGWYGSIQIKNRLPLLKSWFNVSVVTKLVEQNTMV